MSRGAAVAALVALLAAVVTADLGAAIGLRRLGLLARPVSLADLGTARTAYRAPADDPIAGAFRGRDPMRLVADVMTLARVPGLAPGGDMAALYEYVRRGGGVGCGGMARLYFAALVANGLEARIVLLRRSLLDRYDTHTTVEVRVDGRWVVIDPTFHASFALDGRFLGAQEVATAIRKGRGGRLEAVFHGPVTYPARLESYYTHWQALFEYVAVLDRLPTSPGVAERLPPFRYWLGPRLLIERSAGPIDAEWALVDAVVFATVVVLPAAAGSLGLAAAALLLAPLARRRGPVVMRRVRRAAAMPPGLLVRKAVGVAGRELRAAVARRRDALWPTYGAAEAGGLRPLPATLGPVAPRCPVQRLDAAAERYLSHRFDLLGSGWVEAARAGAADPEGRWLAGVVNRANLDGARRRWRLVDPRYRPVDWQLDPKSGYRWSERTWSAEVRYGDLPGVDVKLPWELARMQHLPQLALAHARARERGDAAFASRLAREFRNQVLDFLATNPPRYGVNWSSTMDVAIRVANWVLAHGLFRAAGARFDPPFEAVLAAGVRDHARHIATHLEWSAELRANHYLADVAGLLFAAAALPPGPDVDCWLALGVRELVAEGLSQLAPDGSGFEASTSYHRLSAEMLLLAAALVLGLPGERLAALGRYDHRRHAGPPALPPAPLPLHDLPGFARPTPLPATLLERLERAAECVLDWTGPEGRVAQVGDNDSGRFFKLEPALDARLAETPLDHRHLVAAAAGLFAREDFADFGGPGGADRAVVEALAAGARAPGAAPPRGSGRVRARPGLGLYVLRAPGLWLAVRCGPNGQNGFGGHAHNDQLSFELAFGGRSVVVDPGTGVYTPDHQVRNRFRATAAHATLAVEGLEQNRWVEGREGLFRLSDDARAEVEELRDGFFRGVHRGFGVPHRRTLAIEGRAVAGTDACAAAGTRSLTFPLAPGVRLLRMEGDGSPVLGVGEVAVRLSADGGVWAVEEGEYSPGYGLREPALVLRLHGVPEVTRWRLAWLA